MSNPFFSIILPTHNGEKRIRSAIDSVRMQTFTDYELIIVCDACDDNTQSYAENYNDPRIKIITTNHHRDGLARNAGLDIASGKWILFMDDDDYWLHEYCFKLLAEQALNSPADVIDYSFVWKGKGYKVPSPDESFVMVWCRAWRRSFIADNRFSDIPYGSDKLFYEQMIKDNPDAVISFWNMPLYYYNYMREGSLSWMENNTKHLDIIVTHYNEPWEIGKPFFDMLEHQQCADFNKVQVTLVQDGEETELPWDELLSDYSYDVEVLTLEKHSGVAAARNYGLEHTNAEWVAFCCFDDMFSSVFALNLLLANFPNNDYDLIWGKYAVKTMWCTGDLFINCVDDPNYTTVANKYYRREFLKRKNLLFLPEADIYYDYAFNSIALAETASERVVTHDANDYLYFKNLRLDSIKHSPAGCTALVNQMQDRNIMLFNHLRLRNKQYDAAKMFMKILCTAYYAIYAPGKDSAPPDSVTPYMTAFYGAQKHLANILTDTDIEVIKDETEAEITNLIQSIYNESRMEYYFVNDELSFPDWLEQLDRKADEAEAHEQNEPSEHTNYDSDVTEQEEKKPLRIAVWCGTRNVYEDMITSAKSLLCTTPVDKIVFFTEDDVIPYDIPPVIEVINVQNQQYFPQTSPNYTNTWTYMCMIRAAFPELLPYDKVLSFDIDVIIKDNLSALWDYDLSDYYLAGVPEPSRQKNPSDPIYINFGVVMMNLYNLRKDNKQQEIIDILNRKKVDCPEQGAFNQACAGKILQIPNDYNVTVYSHITGDPQTERIVHFAGHRFWKHYNIVRKYAKMSWDEVMRKQNELNRSV